jgi:tRNA A-37 threonylcarbamoyl transferase component Bud32
MGLSSGTKLGPYEIVSPLGAGGMGEVYRARDTKLNRDVALKVLPESLSHDSERLARFKREAQVLASLNHPNIATIYGFEGSDGIRALAMELVEGQTLAEKIAVAQGPLSGPAALQPTEGGEKPQRRKAGVAVQIDESLPIARQIADALEYAHERGIIHRDLKPANVKVTPEGIVKVLDFGLAKALDLQTSSSDLSNSPTMSPTLSIAATQAGVVIGTAAYMSPEQARGKTVDRRADIWAFGCVLFEMLSGRRPFEGDTVTDILASVVKSEPDWSALPANTPARIRELVRRCLLKDPKQRLRDIGEARITIEGTISGVGAVGVRPSEESAGAEERARRAPRRTLPWVVAGVALILGLAAGIWLNSRQKPPVTNWSAEILGGPMFAMGPRISPDGHTLAFQAAVEGLTQVAVMDTQSGDWTVLTKNRSRGFVTEVNWSPDGSEIYFDREFSVPQGIYSVSRFGGEERLVLKDAKGPEVLPDGSMLVTRLNDDRVFQLYHFRPGNEQLDALDALPYGEDLCPSLRVFHDGKEAVFFGKTKEQDSRDPSQHLYAINLSTGKTRRLGPQLELRIPFVLPILALGVSSDDKSVLVDQIEGSLHRIVSVPRDGSGTFRTVVTLTLPPKYLDEDRNGDLYLDQLDRPYEVLYYPASGGTPEALAGAENASDEAHDSFQLPDGRSVIGSRVAGRRKLLAAGLGGELVTFIQTKEDNSFPACMVGKDKAAFMLGPPDKAVVALATAADGQIVKRFTETPQGQVTALAASPDGATIYYVSQGVVWEMPIGGGQPHRFASGQSVAVDPGGKYVIAASTEIAGIRLTRYPVSRGTGTPIPVQGPLRLAPISLTPNAIGKDGKVLVSITSPDSWFYSAGILDQQTGKVERIPLNFPGDVFAPGWLPDGRVASAGLPTKVTLWRFRPETSGNQ